MPAREYGLQQAGGNDLFLQDLLGPEAHLAGGTYATEP